MEIDTSRVKGVAVVVILYRSADWKDFVVCLYIRPPELVPHRPPDAEFVFPKLAMSEKERRKIPTLVMCVEGTGIEYDW